MGYNAFDPDAVDDGYDDSWLDELAPEDVWGISQETTGLGEQYFGTGKDISLEDDQYTYKTPNGETVGPLLPPGQEDKSAYTSGGNGLSGIFGELESFTRKYQNAIGVGAGFLAYLDQGITARGKASQAADAAEMQRQQKELDYANALARKEKQDADAISRADAKDKLDWERRQQATQEQRDYERETAKQRQADQLALISAQRSGSSSGGGGGFDPAAARAARVSASIKNMKAPTTGIVNSNIWGNAMNTLQRK